MVVVFHHHVDSHSEADIPGHTVQLPVSEVPSDKHEDEQILQTVR